MNKIIKQTQVLEFANWLKNISNLKNKIMSKRYLSLFVISITLLASCSTPNPSPLSEKEINGLIVKYYQMSTYYSSYMERDWERYKQTEEKDGNSVYEQINDFFKYYYPNRQYKEQSPIHYIFQISEEILEDKYSDFKKINRDMDFESFYKKEGVGNIKIVSIDSYPKIPDSYLVKYKEGKLEKGHLLFKMSQIDDLPYVIDFDNNFGHSGYRGKSLRSLNNIRDIFKIAPYELTISYFDYNDSYPYGNLDDLIFNPKNIWGIKIDEVEDKLEKFKKGEYYGYCSFENRVWAAKEATKEEQEIKEEKNYNDFDHKQNVSIYEYDGLKIPEKIDDEDFEESFLDFFEDFSENRASQIALTNKPLRYSYLNDNYDDVLEKWDEKLIQKEWGFWDEKYFIDGIEEIDNQEFIGTWYESSNFIIYKFGIPESGYVQTFIFKKINNKWFLYEFRNWAN